MKKALSLVLAAMMALALCGTAFASSVAYDETVSISGLAADDVVHLYQVIEWVGETADHSDVTGWKAVAPFDTILTQDKLIEVLVGTKDDPDTAEDETAAATGITAELAGELARAATGAGIEVNPVSGTATYTIPQDKEGMYLALITPGDANTIYNPVFVSSDFTAGDNTHAIGEDPSYSDSAAVKKTTVTLEKTADTDEDTWDDGEWYTTAVGDTVSFTVTVTVPGYAGVYENPHFVLTDALTNLELVTDSIVVKVGSDELEAGTDYSKDDVTTAGYKITFDPDWLKSNITATEVTVTYDAIVTVDPEYAVNEENNEVKIEYTHNPNDETDYDVKKDTTQHYTFTLDAAAAGSGTNVSGKKTSEIVKVGVQADGTPITNITESSEITSTETWDGPLAGAVFGLFTDDAGTTPYVPNGETDGLTATTGTDGRMTFAGLDAGTYYLKEISAPAGYVTNSEVVQVTIAATTKTVTVTEVIEGKTVTYDTEILDSYSVTVGGDTSTYTFNIGNIASSTEIQWSIAEMVEKPHAFENVKGVELPSTGGIGTTIFYVAGLLMVLGAGTVLVARRKADEE